MLKFCSDHEASDVLIQGGDYVWAQIHGRQCRVTSHTIKQGHLSQIIAELWNSEVEANIRAGRGADRALEISGEASE